MHAESLVQWFPLFHKILIPMNLWQAIQMPRGKAEKRPKTPSKAPRLALNSSRTCSHFCRKSLAQNVEKLKITRTEINLSDTTWCNQSVEVLETLYQAHICPTRPRSRCPNLPQMFLHFCSPRMRARQLCQPRPALPNSFSTTLWTISSMNFSVRPLRWATVCSVCPPDSDADFADDFYHTFAMFIMVIIYDPRTSCLAWLFVGPSFRLRDLDRLWLPYRRGKASKSRWP